MATVSMEAPPLETLADLLKQLGDVPLNRVRFHPFPGTATEKDVIAAAEAADKRLYELVDGTLVEKAMGYEESRLAVRIIYLLMTFIDPRDLGIVTGEAGTVRLMPGLVRIPDVAFVAWESLPDRQFPENPIPDLVPDLVIEVLSKGNTKREMARKLRDYFGAGVRLAWYIDPKKRTARVFTGVDQSVLLHETDTLDGGAVLPGFQLPLGALFSAAR